MVPASDMLPLRSMLLTGPLFPYMYLCSVIGVIGDVLTVFTSVNGLFPVDRLRRSAQVQPAGIGR